MSVVRVEWPGEIVGHRGAAGLAPENTLLSFETAIAAGCDRVEFDVRVTRDGVVVFHDARLDRFLPPGSPGAGRPLSQLPTALVTQVDVGASFGKPGWLVPTYDQVLEAMAGRVRLNVESKGSGREGLLTVEACRKGLRDHGLVEGTVLSCFHEPVLAHAWQSDPGIERAFIADARTLGDPVAIATRLKAAALHASMDIADEHLLERCRKAGLALRVWTVNEPASMRRFVELAVDGIVSDHPDRLRQVAGR